MCYYSFIIIIIGEYLCCIKYIILRQKNGRLNINELPKGPTIRCHNKLIGILLWLFGKTEVLEGLNVKNEQKSMVYQ